MKYLIIIAVMLFVSMPVMAKPSAEEQARMNAELKAESRYMSKDDLIARSRANPTIEYVEGSKAEAVGGVVVESLVNSAESSAKSKVIAVVMPGVNPLVPVVAVAAVVELAKAANEVRDADKIANPADYQRHPSHRTTTDMLTRWAEAFSSSGSQGGKCPGDMIRVAVRGNITQCMTRDQFDRTPPR